MVRLLRCSACRTKVSEAAPSCPSCGHPLAHDPKFQAARRPRRIATALVAVLLLAMGLGALVKPPAQATGAAGATKQPSPGTGGIQPFAPQSPKAPKVVATVSRSATQAPSSSKPNQGVGVPWYEGGTLHRATLREWNAATDANRLATAADFAATALKAQRLSIDQLLPKAVELLNAIRPSAEDDRLGDLKVSEVAAGSIALLGWH